MSRPPTNGRATSSSNCFAAFCFGPFFQCGLDFLPHQAAKKFFDESGLKKLPTVRSLQTEYAALLAEKKAAYADFRKAREDMKELLPVRANVQKLMGYEAQEQEKEADRREEER